MPPRLVGSGQMPRLRRRRRVAGAPQLVSHRPSPVPGHHQTMMVDKQPFFVYATESRTVTTNQTVTDSLTIQSGSRGFLFERLTAQYDRDDWTVQINLSGLSRNLFDIKLRGALLFGLSAQPAAANVWPGGVEIDPAMYIPPNTTIVIETTNGPSGTLNIAYSLQGRDLLG